MKTQFKKSQEILENYKDSQRDESGSFGVCQFEFETNDYRFEIWKTDKNGLRLFQIWPNGNGFQSWKPVNE